MVTLNGKVSIWLREINMNFKGCCRGFLSLFNYPYISKELLDGIKGPVLLHISDTPVDIYKYIFRIIDILKPKYIIHTGDLADNVKLEIYKDKIEYYYQGTKALIAGLEDNNSEIFYVLGNHDDYKTVSHLNRTGTILNEGPLFLNGINFYVSHYYKEHSNNADFNLFGHSLAPKHYEKDGTIWLNGLININIIDLSNKNVFHLDYPVGTNGSRRMELNRIGL
jgi:predicted phosphodiesterase